MAFYLIFPGLKLKNDDHYNNVISIEKFRSDTALRRFAPGSSGYDWFSKWAQVDENIEQFKVGHVNGPFPIPMVYNGMYV